MKKSEKIGYHRFEIFFGGCLFICGGVLWITSDIVLKLYLWDVFRIFGLVLLGQGLIRDVVMIVFHKHLFEQDKTKVRRGVWLCLESTLGVLILLNALILFLCSDQTMINIPAFLFVFCLSLWWFFGFYTKDMILELRRDPNHFNLIFSFSLSEEQTSEKNL